LSNLTNFTKISWSFKSFFRSLKCQNNCILMLYKNWKKTDLKETQDYHWMNTMWEIFIAIPAFEMVVIRIWNISCKESREKMFRLFVFHNRSFKVDDVTEALSLLPSGQCDATRHRQVFNF
jgi:hypothetical protein